MICAALSFLAMLAIGDWRFDSIRLIRLDGKCRKSQVRKYFPLQPEGVAVVAVEKRKKSPAAAVSFRTANLTARQFLQYIR